MDNENLTAQEEAEVAEPQIANASDEDFAAYIENIKSGGEIRENTPEASDNAASTPENAAEAETEREKEDAKTEEKLFTQADVDEIIGKRLREKREKDSLHNEISAEVMRFYGNDNPQEAMKALMDDLKRQNADRMGLDTADYDSMSEDSRKARLYDEEQQRVSEQQKKTQEFIDRWQRETEDLKTIVPDFDFDKAMNTNSVFRDAVLSGRSIQSAYLLSQKAIKPAAKERKNIQQNGAISKSAAPKADFNPVTASDKEFNDYIRGIQSRG